MDAVLSVFIESGLVYFENVPELFSFELCPVVGNVELTYQFSQVVLLVETI